MVADTVKMEVRVLVQKHSKVRSACSVAETVKIEVQFWMQK